MEAPKVAIFRGKPIRPCFPLRLPATSRDLRAVTKNKGSGLAPVILLFGTTISIHAVWTGK